MKIDEHIKKINIANEAIESAPQKGFINLDQVNNILHEVKLFLEKIAPQLELGEKLADDIHDGMLKKLQALKMAGNTALISQTENAVKTRNLDYIQLKSLQSEIDEALSKVFGGHTKPVISGNGKQQKSSQKPEDYH